MTMVNDQALEVQKQEITDAEGTERTRDRRAFVPRVDIYETDDAMFVVADMPGVTEDAVDITLEKNVLTINGYVEPRISEGYSLVLAEYDEGDFHRSFRVSDEIDRDNIEATMRDGVLHLRLQKAGPAKTRKISVRAG